MITYDFLQCLGGWNNNNDGDDDMKFDLPLVVKKKRSSANGVHSQTLPGYRVVDLAPEPREELESPAAMFHLRVSKRR